MQVQDVVALVLVYAIIAAALGLSQYVQKKGINWDYRKIVHIGVGSFIYIWWAFTENWIMLVFFAIPFAIVLLFAMFPGNLVSNSKIGEITNEQGNRYGLFLYVVSICILVAFFFNHWLAATIAIVAMTRGDGFGSIVGKKLGKHRGYHGKSLEGSAAVFVATVVGSFIIIVLYGFLASTLPAYGILVNAQTVDIFFGLACCVLAGAITCVVEALSPGEFDNILIALCVAVPLAILGL